MTAKNPPVAMSVLDLLAMEIARRTDDSAMHLGALLTLPGPPPSLDELTAHLRARLHTTPELTYRAAGSGRRSRWEPDPTFDIHHHVHDHTLTQGGDARADRMLTAVLDQPLTADRPLWGVWRIRSDNDYGLCYRAHHSFQDGQAAIRTIERLFGAEPHTHATQHLTPETPVHWTAAAIKDLLPLRRTAHWSALDEPLTGRRVASTATVELSRLHAIARATHTSVNQVCLAAVASLLRAWHPGDFPHPDSTLRATLGISLRAPHEPLPLLGNKLGAVYIPLPCGEPSALRRLDLLRTQAAFERLAGIGRHYRALLQNLPYWCGKLGLLRSIDPRYVPLTLADVRFRRPLAFNGNPVQAAHLLPVLLPGQPLFIAWTTYRKHLHTTFLTDTALPGHENLANMWQRAIDTLEKVGLQ